MNGTVRLGALHPLHRARLADILRRTAVFRDDEIGVALELFDEAVVQESDPHGEQEASPTTGSDYVFLGAFTPEDELVGYACYGPTPDTDRTYDLYWIAVDPSAQGTGSGTLLLHEVERRLQGQNARMLVVETSSRSDYESSRAFYMRRGFAEAARVREFYAPADDRIIFTKRFQEAPAGRGATSQ